MTVLAIANAKGGVGKTTTALTLAAALADGPASKKGSPRVLLVDLDPGGGLTGILRRPVEDPASSAHRLLTEPEADLSALPQETDIPGVDLVASHPVMSTLDAQLSTVVDREFRLRTGLASLTAGARGYGWVVLDSGPYMGILSINVLTAAHAVVLPLPPEFVVLLGGRMLLDYVQQIRDHFNPELRILGILPTMVDARTRHAREMLDQLRSVFGDLVFEQAIPYTVRLKEAPILGASILSYDPSCRAAEAYRALAGEVQARCRASV